MAKEVIFLHIGQAGVQIGESCWELFCHESGIKEDGEFLHRNENGEEKNKKSNHSIFNELPSGKFVPRCIYIDMDPTPIECIMNGRYRNLFVKDNFVKGKEGGRNIYCCGHYGCEGKDLCDATLKRVRKEVEKCSNFMGFIVTHSVCGGTGSGLASLLLEKLSIDYRRKRKMSFTIYPSPQYSSSVVAPYNAVLSTHSILEHTDLCILLDNERLYNFLEKNYEICNPCFSHVNRLIAQNIESVTSTFRYQKSMFMDLNSLLTNLVPYPRIHFCTTSLCSSSFPIFNNMGEEEINNENKKKSTLENFTKNVLFDPEYSLASINTENALVYGACLNYRGQYLLPSMVTSSVREVRKTIDEKKKFLEDYSKKAENRRLRNVMNRRRKKQNLLLSLKPEIPDFTSEEINRRNQLKKQIRFVDWSPTGLKIGITQKKIPRDFILFSNKSDNNYTEIMENYNEQKYNCCGIMNSTMVGDIFSRTDHKFDLMYAKRAFIHWFFTWGMESGEFPEAREDLGALEKDYEEWKYTCGYEYYGESEGDVDDDMDDFDDF